MAFYLKPPRGIIPIHILQKCVEERLKFFKSMDFSHASIHTMECLFEDSAFDRAGHFTLRLAALRDVHFRHFFIKHELLLLNLRLDTYSNGHSLGTFLVTIIRHTRECIAEGTCSKKMLDFLKTCEIVFFRMVSKDFRTHVFQDLHTPKLCKKFNQNVPFQHCLSLLTTYSYNVVKGLIKVPCTNWKSLLLSLYNTYLHIALHEMQYNSSAHRALADTRIQLVLSVVPNPHTSNTVAFSNRQLDIKYLPLCMQNLHSVLRKTHRLNHEERFNMSLFLKDIGVPLNDSISYWKSEYSQSTTCSKCMHNWQKDEKRYIYSIRHIYGLEGSRRTYQSRPCSYFQNMVLSPLQEGGCPFKHFDAEQLKRLITYTLELWDLKYRDCDNIYLERLMNASNACALFALALIENLKKDSVCDISFNSPVQYYRMMKCL